MTVHAEAGQSVSANAREPNTGRSEGDAVSRAHLPSNGARASCCNPATASKTFLLLETILRFLHPIRRTKERGRNSKDGEQLCLSYPIRSQRCRCCWRRQ